jgi:transposase
MTKQLQNGVGVARAMKRHELSDEQWALVEPLLPQAKTGRKPRDRRQILNAIFWILHTGAPWRDLPERFPPWKTAYNTFSRWHKANVFAQILDALQIRLDREGRIDWDLWCIDGTHIRASRAAAGADKKVERGTRRNRQTMRWAAAEAGLDPNSTWLLTARELH